LVGRFLFDSHDAYGLGHVRRNSSIARAVLATDPAAQVSLVTGTTRITHDDGSSLQAGLFIRRFGDGWATAGAAGYVE